MAPDNVHSHDYRPPDDLGPAFRWAVGQNAAYVLVEGSAGWITGSLAPLADAAHNLTELAGLLIAWGAAVLAKRAVTARHTCGLGRATILAAFFNATATLVGVGAVTWEAAHRLSDPVAVPGLTVTDDYQTQGLSL
jgi:cobalt-zinc-cadmium efflux system protein